MSPSWAAQISLVLSGDKSASIVLVSGKILPVKFTVGYLEALSLRWHRPQKFTHVEYTVVSNPMEESIVLFQMVLLPQTQFSLYNPVPPLSNFKVIFHLSTSSISHPMAPTFAVCSLYTWCAQPAACPCFFFCLASLALIMNKGIFWRRENSIYGQTGISSVSFLFSFFFLFSSWLADIYSGKS